MSIYKQKYKYFTEEISEEIYELMKDKYELDKKLKSEKIESTN